jgi:hypothetical protein
MLFSVSINRSVSIKTRLHRFPMQYTLLGQCYAQCVVVDVYTKNYIPFSLLRFAKGGLTRIFITSATTLIFACVIYFNTNVYLPSIFLLKGGLKITKREFYCDKTAARIVEAKILFKADWKMVQYNIFFPRSFVTLKFMHFVCHVQNFSTQYYK